MTKLTAYAPARVNLIGEHTDYNGGMVLPAALSIGMTVELMRRSGDTTHIRSTQFDEPVARDLSEAASGHWSDPVVGALREARTIGLLDAGKSADVAINSTIPPGSGLSSSAALIVAILKALASNGTANPHDNVLIAKDARRVENEYLGVPCGIMDQMAVALAAPGSAMALDTKTLDYRLVPLPKSHELIVLHSGIYRQLTEGRYAIRKQECDVAKAYFATDDLCLLEPEYISSSTLDQPAKSRALHCAKEHRRTVHAATALEDGDMETLGALMNQSHTSMRDHFDMSLPAIDALVSTAVKCGAIGARLTGGGFGGCIVALVAQGAREEWLDAVLEKHPAARFIDATSGQ